ncbi:nuclear transport factor 2 family protein [Brevundimonas faecalis]|uniref:nuclear transport factor 2 family protein n=1 Tax=Brevundimonas faecalis TaxID=947378 RepID=UPI00362034E7
MPFVAGLIAALALHQSPASPPVALPDQTALEAAIAERDAALFSVMFDGCDPAALADLVTEDVEFYHDKGGLIATRAAFVADYRKNCEARRAPDAWRSRRELVPGTMRVYPIPGVGAVEEGGHVFYERQGDGPETLVGRARFSVLWRWEDGRWRLARAFSIDHASVSADGR